MSPVSRRYALAGGGALALGAAAIWRWTQRRRRGAAEAEVLYANPLAAPDGGLSVFHLGHSLVGRDMPAMLAQLAGEGHSYASQLGWGTSLRDHWEPDVEIAGFEEENDHPHFLPAKEALQGGGFDALVLTEMVEIKDAIRYHDSPAYLALWAGLARDVNPEIRVYLYETWHHTDDGNGWLARIDRDLRHYWQDRVTYPALASTDAPIHLIPAGQVMAAFVRAAAAAGGLPDVQSAQDLFITHADGTPDTIHFNDLGAYLVALTHYAVLYHRDPRGLPHKLDRADGSPANAPTAETAALMQRVVWDVIGRHPETGVAA